MFGKKKKEDQFDENESVEITEDDLETTGEDKIIEDDSVEDDFETKEEKEKREKQEAKEEAKALKKQELEEINETLDPTLAVISFVEATKSGLYITLTCFSAKTSIV